MEGKYVKVNGKLRLNPNYNNQTTAKTTVINPKALTIVSSPNVFVEDDTIRAPKPLMDVIEVVQDDNYLNSFHTNEQLDSGELLEGLSQLFVQNEIPIGLMGHLLPLRWYVLHFVIDDSGSMTYQSNLKRGGASQYCNIQCSPDAYLSRWQEAEDRLHILFDLVAYVPVKDIIISFLNSTRKIVLTHDGKTPAEFMSYAHSEIYNVFRQVSPSNGTPLYSAMYTSINNALRSGIPTSFYFVTDGAPSGGAREIRQIENLLVSGRGNNLKLYPVTFLSCSNSPRDIEWMHESEEVSQYVATLHDFIDEQLEVYNDQGPIFPYSRGLWLLANLVATFDADGLDAMDQHVPLTKSVLDNLLGRVHSKEEYREYFVNHPTWTGGLVTRTNAYVRHRTRVFEDDYDLFLNSVTEGEIPSVIYFRSNLSSRLKRDIDNEDDNSEAIEIQNVEDDLKSARRRGQFNSNNSRLLQNIQARTQKYNSSIQNIPVAEALPYTPADDYAYPIKLNVDVRQQPISVVPSAPPMYYNGNNNSRNNQDCTIS
jgi:hypothetical protein